MNRTRELQEGEISSCPPLVSVIIPAYNASAFIEQTLDAVLSQTYQQLEVIVVNDGSNDRTVEIVENIAQRDDRVILLHQPNSGVAAARNLAIQHATGEFIAPIDADDIWDATNIEKQVQCFAQSPASVGVVYSWTVDIDEYNQPTGGCRASLIKGNVYLALLCHNFLGSSSASLIRRTCLETVGSYNTTFLKQQAQGCEDWDLYLRLAEYYEYRVVSEFLVGYRKVTGSMSSSAQTMARSHQLMLQAVKRKYPKIPQFLYQLSSSSFYLYLARQSDQNCDHKSTLYWLKQAVSVDRITPLIRLGFYQLLLKSYLNRAPASVDYLDKHYSHASAPQQSSHSAISVQNSKKTKPQVWSKLLVGWVVQYGAYMFSKCFEHPNDPMNMQQGSLKKWHGFE
jgi:glycosyltransferase involved in cell wall biosynthesis